MVSCFKNLDKMECINQIRSFGTRDVIQDIVEGF